MNPFLSIIKKVKSKNRLRGGIGRHITISPILSGYVVPCEIERYKSLQIRTWFFCIVIFSEVNVFLSSHLPRPRVVVVNEICALLEKLENCRKYNKNGYAQT